MYNAPCHSSSYTPLYTTPPLPCQCSPFCIYSIIMRSVCCQNLLPKRKVYFIKHRLFLEVSRHLCSPRACMNECAPERERKRVKKRERGRGGNMCRWVYYLIAIGNGGARKKFSAKSDISVACFRKQVKERGRKGKQMTERERYRERLSGGVERELLAQFRESSSSRRLSQCCCVCFECFSATA